MKAGSSKTNGSQITSKCGPVGLALLPCTNAKSPCESCPRGAVRVARALAESLLADAKILLSDARSSLADATILRSDTLPLPCQFARVPLNSFGGRGVRDDEGARTHTRGR
jgi:hypothetical protein